MKIKISDIFYVKTGSRIREEDVYSHKGNIPCVTAQTSNDGIAWYADEEWLKSFTKNGESVLIDEECITWSKDGVNAGTLFYKNYKFFPIDVCGVLIPKERNQINLKWFLYSMQNIIKENTTSSSSQPKVYNEQMSNIEIDIPTNNDGTFDIDMQNKFVEEYEKLNKYVKLINEKIMKLETIINSEIIIEKYITKSIEEIAILNKGSNKISEENIYKNYDSNGIPVYSSATFNEGLMGRVSKEYYESFDKQGKKGELTWTTNGYAGVVFYRETDYLYSEKCGRIILRKEFKEKINPKFLKIYLNQITYKYKTSESNNGKLDIIHMLNVPVRLPIDKDGNIDLGIQDSIVKKYQDLDDLKNRLVTILKKCNSIINND